MTEILSRAKDEGYRKGELSPPNIKIIDKIVSDEIINLPGKVIKKLVNP